jgi:hydroxylysine kinase
VSNALKAVPEKSMTMAITDDTILATPTPVRSLEAAAAVAARFGVTGEASPLSSERDSNYRIAADDGREYLLKITNPAEDVAVSDFQTQTLLHVARADPSLPIPRPLPATNGEHQLHINDAGPEQIARLMTYLPGVQLHHVQATRALRRNIGANLARLDRALEGFSHPMSGYTILWDLKHAPGLRDLLGLIDDPDRRALAATTLDAYEARVAPATGDLRWQVIHNDFNRHNLLCASEQGTEVTGIIDFGDIVKAPRINDLAIACAYHTGADSWARAAEIAAGYNADLALTALERQLLPDLIATRLGMTVLITGWRAAKYPENRDYILRNARQGWEGLGWFASAGRQTVQQMFDEALA